MLAVRTFIDWGRLTFRVSPHRVQVPSAPSLPPVTIQSVLFMLILVLSIRSVIIEFFLRAQQKGHSAPRRQHYAQLATDSQRIALRSRIGMSTSLKRISLLAASGSSSAALLPSLKLSLISPRLPTTLQKSRMKSEFSLIRICSEAYGASMRVLGLAALCRGCADLQSIGSKGEFHAAGLLIRKLRNPANRPFNIHGTQDDPLVLL